MRKGLLAVGATLVALMTTNAFAQSGTSTMSYSTANRGAMSVQTTGGADAMVVGSARVQPSASTTPSGVAIFGYRQNGVLVTEAGVPGMTAMISGRTYAEVRGATNTGLAFANPTSAAVVVSFYFTDQLGNDFAQGSLTLGANAQVARFLNEAPFNVTTNFAGTFTFNASAPVGVIALRTFVNERSEFLVTTQTVVSMSDAGSSGALVMAHFADGGGWRTQVILINTTDTPVSGTVQFYGEGSATVAATPLTLTVNGQVGITFAYTVRARSSVNLETSGPIGAAAQVGSVRITPAATNASPSAFAVFSLTTNGVTVSQATVQAQAPGTTFRSYVEINSSALISGSIQTGIAIANNSSAAATVNFELTAMDGTSTGLTASINVAANGHVSKFVPELFAGISDPFQGVLRITSSSSVSVVALRTRYNERGSFLITTTPASNEASASTTAELIFPHIVDRGGYTTQFVLFSGTAGQTSSGTLRFFAQEGQALNLSIR